MKAGVDLPWNRYGLIVELAQKLEGTSPAFGRTVLQKLVYLLQSLHKVEVGYDFELYTYGPFSSTLLSDLDIVASLEGVRVDYVLRTGGYRISPGTAACDIRERAHSFLDKHASKINGVVTEFGRFTAAQLELRSTLIFADQDSKREGLETSIDGLVHRVHELKPHFNESAIRQAANQLQASHYL